MRIQIAVLDKKSKLVKIAVERSKNYVRNRKNYDDCELRMELELRLSEGAYREMGLDIRKQMRI